MGIGFGERDVQREGAETRRDKTEDETRKDTQQDGTEGREMRGCDERN